MIFQTCLRVFFSSFHCLTQNMSVYENYGHGHATNSGVIVEETKKQASWQRNNSISSVVFKLILKTVWTLTKTLNWFLFLLHNEILLEADCSRKCSLFIKSQNTVSHREKYKVFFDIWLWASGKIVSSCPDCLCKSFTSKRAMCIIPRFLPDSTD